MHTLNDIEAVLNDNLSLRKNYQLAKTHSDNLQKQLKQTKQKYEQLADTHTTLLQQNSKLAEKNKSLQAQLANINASFVSQIQEMKMLIQQKENELENFQLKMIPSLDQDMLRVKLIAEMEGPYQEAVDKKDREISRLKDQLHQLKREKQIAEFSLATKEKQYRKQHEQSRAYYDTEIERLTRQLSHFSHKSHSTKMQKQMLRAYRQQIDQLRSSSQFHKKAEQEVRKELSGLRSQRERLLVQLANANAQKAIQLRDNSNDGAIRELRLAKGKLEDQLQVSQRENNRLKQKIKLLEQQRVKKQQKYEWQLKDLKSSYDQQRQKFRSESNDFKDEIRKLRDQLTRREYQLAQVSQKYKQSQSSMDRLNSEITSLKIQINSNAIVNFSSTEEVSKYKRVEEVERTVREKIEKETVERLEQDLRRKIRDQIHQEETKRRQEQGLIREDVQKIFRMVSDKIDKETLQKWQLEMRKQIRQQLATEFRKKQQQESPKRQHQPAASKNTTKQLQQKIRKLSQKLEYANRKILQLLKQKAHRGEPAGQITDMARTRSHSYSPEHDYNRLLLEHRDCSFVPMCPPVLVSPIELIPPF